MSGRILISAAIVLLITGCTSPYPPYYGYGPYEYGNYYGKPCCGNNCGKPRLRPRQPVAGYKPPPPYIGGNCGQCQSGCRR